MSVARTLWRSRLPHQRLWRRAGGQKTKAAAEAIGRQQSCGAAELQSSARDPPLQVPNVLAPTVTHRRHAVLAVSRRSTIHEFVRALQAQFTTWRRNNTLPPLHPARRACAKICRVSGASASSESSSCSASASSTATSCPTSNFQRCLRARIDQLALQQAGHGSRRSAD